jgi:prenyltransferase beta subunit
MAKFKNIREVKGSELIFISCINRDGSGTIDILNADRTNLNNTTFTLTSLSITNGTYIASEFNSYVVKIK